MKRTALKPGKPLGRKTPMPRATKPLPQVSAKRRAEAPLRREVKAAALARDGGCVARLLVPEVTCLGPLDGDEAVPRSLDPGAHLKLDRVQTLCRAHHDWKTTHPAEAHDRGLQPYSWELTREG